MADVIEYGKLQPRYEPVRNNKDGLPPAGIAPITFTSFRRTVKLAASAINHEPEYKPESKVRDEWLWNIWRSDSLTSGIINSQVQRDVNRGWSLVGPYSTVKRTKDIFHTAERGQGWRAHIEQLSLSFLTTDIGAIIHAFREGKIRVDGKTGKVDIPALEALMSFDPTRCELTGEWQRPVSYEARTNNRTAKARKLPMGEVYRFASMRDIREEYNGLGYSFMSRILQLLKLMIMTMGHYDEMLGSRAPNGFIIINGVSQAQFEAAMGGREAMLQRMNQLYFGDVAVLANSSGTDIKLEFVPVSRLPQGFDMQKFVEMVMMGMALCAGYPADEFWQVSTGRGYGRTGEINFQTQQAGNKGRNEFAIKHQEILQSPGFLSNRVFFEYDKHDASERITQAQVVKSWMEALKLAEEIGVSPEEAMRIGVEEGALPPRVTQSVEDSIATDTGPLKSSVSDENINVDESAAVQDAIADEEPEAVTRQRLLDDGDFRDRMRSIKDAGDDDEPIVIYKWRLAHDGWPVKTETILWESASKALK